MLARLLVIALLVLALPPQVTRAETREFESERGIRCRLESREVTASLYCYDPTASTPSPSPSYVPEAGYWYQCYLERHEDYIQADCQDAAVRWSQVIPTGW